METTPNFNPNSSTEGNISMIFCSAASLALNAEGNVPADLSLERLYDQLVV
jgi:hypothetical protein